jgi:hypothetical protein
MDVFSVEMIATLQRFQGEERLFSRCKTVVTFLGGSGVNATVQPTRGARAPMVMALNMVDARKKLTVATSM